MILRRDWQLQQLCITQWVLHRPMALQGEFVISFPINTKLVIVANSLFNLNEALLSDVLRALKVSVNQVLQIKPNRAAMLPLNIRYNIWWLGCKEIPKLGRGRIVSPSLKELQRNHSARIALWRQICKYEYYFFSHYT